MASPTEYGLIAALVAVTGVTANLAMNPPEFGNAASSLVAPSPARSELIGFACGAQRLTMTAVEEDEFPARCEAIERVADVCGPNVTGVDCVAYMGREGW